MKIKWRCSCGFKGESEIGYWMRCDNKSCNDKNAFQITDMDLQNQAKSFEERLIKLEGQVHNLNQRGKWK